MPAFCAGETCLYWWSPKTLGVDRVSSALYTSEIGFTLIDCFRKKKHSFMNDKVLESQFDSIYCTYPIQTFYLAV